MYARNVSLDWCELEMDVLFGWNQITPVPPSAHWSHAARELVGGTRLSDRKPSKRKSTFAWNERASPNREAKFYKP
jgi:hypothetical protein